MTSYYDEEFQYYDPAGSLEQNLVDALDVGVQQSVNQALIKAIEPLKRHLFTYAEQQGWLPPGAPRSTDVVPTSNPIPVTGSPPGPHTADFARLADTLAQEHDYGAPTGVSIASHGHDDASSPESELGEDPSAGKRKARNLEPTPPKFLTFDPKEIVHPTSNLWLPPQEVADYVETHIQQGFDKDVRARLRAECPRPDLTSKVTDTPEVDPTLISYLKTSSTKDPKK